MPRISAVMSVRRGTPSLRKRWSSRDSIIPVSSACSAAMVADATKNMPHLLLGAFAEDPHSLVRGVELDVQFPVGVLRHRPAEVAMAASQPGTEGSAGA